MSEPVGNAPRKETVPSNTLKDREKRQAAPKPTVGSTAASANSPTPAEEREPAEKIIQGVVTTRKVAWWRKFGRSIFASDLASLGDYLYTDLFIPTVRNAIREFGVGAIDRAVYGAKMAPHRGPIIGGIASGASSISTRYDRISEGSRVISREARARHDFDEIIFPDREEAVYVLAQLVERIERYRVATVADLFTFCGVSSGDFAAGGHGWTDLSTAVVRQRYGGWHLDLPEPEPIRN